MAKQYYGCIRLTKHNPGWSDPINDIHLLRTHRTFKCVLEDYDLRPIIRGIKDGLIEFTRADIEGTADSDDGARLPQYCGKCICQQYLIKEGVLADYLAEVDYQSELEWQPPQPAEAPAKTPNVQVTIPAQIEAGAVEVFQVKLDQLKPKKEMVDTGEVDENGEPIMEEQEVHQTVIVSVTASGGTVSPAELTFSSDPESEDYYMNAKEVTFTAPDESANVTIEFSGDGIKAKSQSVRVQGDEPIPEEPDQPQEDPYVTINGERAEIILNRGQVSLEDAVIAVVAGSCTDITLANISMQLINKADTNTGYAGTDGVITVADTTTISGICQPKSGEECVAAEIKITGSCGCGGHQIDQTIQLKVPEAKGFLGTIEYTYMVFNPDQLPTFNPGHDGYLDDKMTMDIEPREEYDISDIGSGLFYVLIVPEGSPRQLVCLDPQSNVIEKYVSLPFIVSGVDYVSQAVAFPAGGSSKARID